MKYLCILFLCLISLTASASIQKRCNECVKDVDFKDAEKVLKAVWSRFAPLYTIANINSATIEEIDGYKIIINADIADGDLETRTCISEILVQSLSVEDITVTYDCAGEWRIPVVYNTLDVLDIFDKIQALLN